MGAYWEVALNDANFSRLAQMDVIYLPISRVPTLFTETQRRLLTELANSGVTIWVDSGRQWPHPGRGHGRRRQRE